jgi:hypothetical protein
MTRIVQKRGVGVPKADQMVTAELAVDIQSGTLYTKLSSEAGGAVVPISGGGGSGDGYQNIDGGNAGSIYLLDQIIEGGSA